jgi:PilZ domain-containing protein
MKDKRKHRRFALNSTDNNGRMLSASYVRVLDISISGVSFEADRRLNMGQEYTLQLKKDGKGMALKGIIVWSSVVGSKGDDKGNIIPIYRAGMKFTIVSQEVIDFIEIRRHETNEGDEKIEDYKFDIEGLDMLDVEKEELEKFVNSIYG